MTATRGGALLPDPYTIELRLCDEQGVIDLEQLNLLRELGRHGRYEGASFPCTGSAHLAGEHVRCSSPAHTRVAGLVDAETVQLVAGGPLAWQVVGWEGTAA